MLTFKTKLEALNFLASQENLRSNIKGDKYFPGGTYYLSHGEYSQPDYSPRKYKEGWGIHIENYYYAGTFNVPKSGRVETM